MEQNFSVPALAGKTLFSCFFSQGAFCAQTEGKETAFTEEHAHANFELLFIRKGEGIQFIRNVAHEYAPGDVFVFAPFTPHASVCRSNEGDKRISLRFAVRRTDLFPGENDRENPVKVLQNNGFFAFHAQPQLTALISLLEEKAEKAEVLALSGIMSAILSFVFEALAHTVWETADLLRKNSPVADDGLDRRFLIDQFFDQLVNRNSTIEELCRQVYLSPAQLNRVIKEMFGVTFKQKLIEVRLAYIKDFLKYSDLSISDIAQRNGFSDTANFSLFFKKHLGESPTRYRAREREKML